MIYKDYALDDIHRKTVMIYQTSILFGLDKKISSIVFDKRTLIYVGTAGDDCPSLLSRFAWISSRLTNRGYHQCGALDIIKPKEKFTIHGYAVMICKDYALDDIPNLR